MAGQKANFVAFTAMPLSAMLLEPRRRAGRARGRLALAPGNGRRRHGRLVLHLRRACSHRPLNQFAQILEHGTAGRRRRDAGVRDPRREARDRRPRGAARSPPSRATSRWTTSTSPTSPAVPILHDVTLAAKPGQKIGLVGPTGAGKSTIINVITALLRHPAPGTSASTTRPSTRRHDGEPAEDRRHGAAGAVPVLRHGHGEHSLRRAGSDRRAVHRGCASKASAHGFIAPLPEGYDTVLDGGGSNLSQGQRQLITIARASSPTAPC